ncbi:hypothetical protein [Bremerella cremea]|uniref:hypothetical protein n=1 Tax=Bremerella cremea TaxID=1031537 RepID=UPI0031E80779
MADQMLHRLLKVLPQAIGILVILTWLGSLSRIPAPQAILLPFAWTDVAVVLIVAGLPLGWTIRNEFHRRFDNPTHSIWGELLLGTLLLTGFRLLFWNQVDQYAPVMLLSQSMGLSRMLGALSASLGLTLLGATWFPAPVSPSTTTRWLVSSLLFLVVPWTYQQARCNAELDTAMDQLSQTRLVEANDRLRSCLVLEPSLQHQGIAVRKMVEQLTLQIAEIQQQSAMPLAADAPIERVVPFAIQLAVLGRGEEATRLLNMYENSPGFAAHGGHQVLGTLYQDRREWRLSLDHFRLAEKFWADQASSPSTSAALASSIQGTAFALRKLGRVFEAEEAYQRLLDLNPSAETHFLLAQFYEDIQHSSLAAHHARRSIELHPQQYKTSGEALIHKMQASHFRCFQLFPSGS